MPQPDKHAVRLQAHAARAAQPDKESVSEQVLAMAMALPEYQHANCVLFYVDVRDEVRTRPAIEAALRSRKTVAVPYCVGKHLQLFRLQDWSQLAPGCFGLLEPKPELRAQYMLNPNEIDLVLAPGVAFDRHGNRMGHGQGFYDRLLADVPPSTLLVGLAYDCQVYSQLATEPHDIAMDRVVTQSRVYIGQRRAVGG